MVSEILTISQPSGEEAGEDKIKTTWPSFDRLRAAIKSTISEREGHQLTLVLMKKTSGQYMKETDSVRDQRLSLKDRSSLFYHPPVLHMAEEPDMEKVLSRNRHEVRSAWFISLNFSNLSSFIIISL